MMERPALTPNRPAAHGSRCHLAPSRDRVTIRHPAVRRWPSGSLHMSRDSPSRRLLSPAEPIVSPVAAAASTSAAPAVPPLITLLARSPQLVDLLPQLHQRALECHRWLLFAALRAQPAKQRTARHLGLRSRRSAPRHMGRLTDRASHCRRRLRPQSADVRRRRRSADAGPGPPAWRGERGAAPAARAGRTAGGAVCGRLPDDGGRSP